MKSVNDKLSLELRQKVTDFLSTLPDIQEKTKQQAFLSSARLDTELDKQIKMGLTIAEFVPLLIDTLVSYGELEDGRNALEAILETSKQYIGRERRVYCDSLIREVHAANPGMNKQEIVNTDKNRVTSLTKMEGEMLRKNILQYLSQQAPGEKVSLRELSEQFDTLPEYIGEALDELYAKRLVAITALSRSAMLCEITLEGKKIVKDLV